jgi:hypothetical protein
MHPLVADLQGLSLMGPVMLLLLAPYVLVPMIGRAELGAECGDQFDSTHQFVRHARATGLGDAPTVVAGVWVRVSGGRAGVRGSVVRKRRPPGIGSGSIAAVANPGGPLLRAVGGSSNCRLNTLFINSLNYVVITVIMSP